MTSELKRKNKQQQQERKRGIILQKTYGSVLSVGCLVCLSGLVCHGGVRNEEPGATVDRVRLLGLTIGNRLSGIRLSAIDARQSAPSFSVRLPASEYPVSSSSSIRQQQQMAVLLGV
ncbi:hypothetical protein BDB00DRAFT_789415 [Zychaea mexicana]|uniref:uncharacterized protein n=1 Tax=Zychaea mexicana TaxID=64656 RepID=UPI0022FE438E|nr:uncharacterized protein BDB00DRAFT_789415 [Zychaea mexicana]KAI9491584.1 hypothetical protein BDB00DRAFT_789415 [Zychaea mexicana]